MRLLPALLGLAIVLSPCVHAAEIPGLPKPAAPRTAQFAKPLERTLANGLRVIVVERPGLPLLSAALVLRTGAEADPAKLAGLGDFTAGMLTQGTVNRSATQIAQEVEALGATIKAETQWDATVISLEGLSTQATPAFALFAEIIRQPKFAEEEIDRTRRQSLDELKLALEEPGNVARVAARRLVLGDGRYAHSSKGTLTSLPNLTRDDLVRYHAAQYVPANAFLILAGNLTADAGFALAEKSFGDWKASESKPAELPAYRPVEKPRVVLVDLAEAGQAAVAVSGPGLPRTADEYFAGLVANTVLGGGYTSRLNQEIRIKRGLSYGAGSALNFLRVGGFFTARAQTKNQSAAEVAQVIQAELRRLSKDLVPVDYLATRQAVVTGKMSRELETNAGYVTTLASFALYNLPIDALGNYLERINAVTAEDVRAYAAKHLTPEAMSILVVGQAKTAGAPLKKAFKDVEIIPQAEFDLDSPTLRAPAKP